MMKVIPLVISVTPKENYHLFLTFNNGEKGLFDASIYISPHSFSKLWNVDFFNKAYVDHGTVCWPEEIEFPRDTLYIETIHYKEVHQLLEESKESEAIEEKGSIPEVISVRALPDYYLEVVFKPNEKRLFDAKNILAYPCFERLKDKDFFNKVYVDFRTINWPGNIDYDPEDLYQNSIPCKSSNG